MRIQGVDTRDIKFLQQEAEKDLVKHIANKHTGGDFNKAYGILYNSRTYSNIMDVNSRFWWKSKEELVYLMDREIAGDWISWKFQAF